MGLAVLLCVVLAAILVPASVNAARPYFKSPLGNLALSEDTRIGTTVGTVVANDFRNTRKSVRYTIDSDKFKIMNPFTGAIILTAPLDAEANKGGVPVTLFATFFDSSTPEMIEKKTIILITDVNDNAPHFTKTDFKFEVLETAPVGTVVERRIEIKDVDTKNAILEVKCIEEREEIEESCKVFAVVKTTSTNTDWYGDIILKEPLDYEKQPLWQLPLDVFDGINTLSQTIEILVRDVQDTPPQFLHSYSETVYEGIPIGTSILTVKAEDGDRGVARAVVYEIIENVCPGDGDVKVCNNGWFAIDEVTGEITTTIVLDRDDPKLYDGFVKLKVKAREVIDAAKKIYGDDKITTQTADVTITVLDLNDHGPRWIIGTPRVDVREDITNGRPVPGLLATVVDEDQISDLAFHEITQLDHTDTFTFDPNSGTGRTIITFNVKQPLDYERFDGKPAEYVIRMLARETKTKERRSSTGTVTIKVVDVNDITPLFNRVGNYETSIIENAPVGNSVIQIDATDKDSGNLGKLGIRYSLIGNGAEKFNLDLITGLVTVADCSPDKPGEGRCLDYERERTYLLTVLAQDELGTGRRASRGLIIRILDANDNRPKCRFPKYTGYILEGQTKPDPELRVLARDMDSSNSNNNLITYFVRGSDNYVVSNNGLITARTPVRIETGGSVVELKVEVKDAIGGETCTVIMNIIDVNDHSPLFTNNAYYETDIYETAPPGTSVVTVEADDLDPPNSANGQIASYRIESGALGKFRIDTGTGKIQVAAGATFDYDVQQEYFLTVIAPDKGSPQRTGRANVKVNILDKNNKRPVFQPTVRRVPVWENTTLSTSIITMTAVDPDPGATLKYKFTEPITASDPRRRPVDPNVYNYKDLFSINEDTGEVTLVKPLDYSKTAEISYTIQATDTNAPDVQIGLATLIISVLDINEVGPTFARPWTPQIPDYTISVKEEQPVPSFVMTAVANDPDSAIAAYVISKNDGGYFAISKLTGVVESVKRLDYEQIQRLDFVVTAYDYGIPVLSATANVRVNVININDITPQFNQSGYEETIFENSPGGTYVVTVKADDGDAEDYGVVKYKISSHSDQFEIDPDTGVMRVKAGAILDRELTPYITVQVTAEDSPLDARVRNRNSVPVYITLLDINDHIPKFINDEYFAEIIENTPVDTSVIRVQAMDGDKTCACPNADLAYVKISGDNTGYFTVTRETGLIAVAQSVMGQDYDHVFMVSVNDEDGKGPVPRQAKVTIRVVKSNNKPPIWIIPPENNMTIDVLENQYLGMVIYQVHAEDQEAGDRGFVSYYFLYDNSHVDRTPEFRINELTGVIHARIVYDREAVINVYRLYLVASDKGNPPFNSTRILTVRVRDVDDNIPEFPRARDGSVIPYNLNVPENAPKNTWIGEVVATDRDSVAYGKIFYTIVSGNPDDTFRIENINNIGKLYTNKDTIDREAAGLYNLEIRASNNASDQYLNTKRRRRAVDPSAVTVRITVSDTNDNIPQFQEKLYQTCISSDDSFGKSLLTVSATDLDTGESGTIRYKISKIDNKAPGGDSEVKNAFVVGEINGTVYSNTLNTQYEDTYFDITLQASNPNSPVGEMGNGNVHIFVTNPLDMVKVTASRGPEEVNRYLKDYKKALSDSTNGGIVCIDDIRYHLGADAVEIDRSDIFIHIIDKDKKTSIAASSVAEQLNAAKTGALVADFSILFIDDVNVVDTGMEKFEIHPVFIVTCIIVIILICALILLCCVCYFIRRSFRKGMERAKYIHEEPLYGNGSSVNPLWQKSDEQKTYQGFSNEAFLNDEAKVAPPMESGAAPPALPAGGPPQAPPPPPIQ